MARFRCPTTTSSFGSVELATSSTQRVGSAKRVSKVAKMTIRPNKTSKRVRSTTENEKKVTIREARRLEKLRLERKRHVPSFVYVGNVPPSATEASLRTIFRRCGMIEEITIRCSSGAAVLMAKSNAQCTPRDRQYATIIFARQKSVSKALDLNGSDLHGFELMVCLSPAQLPDMKQIIEWRVKTIKERKGISRRPKTTGYRGLMPAPTERVVTPHNHPTLRVDKSQSVDIEMQPLPTTNAPKPLVRNFMFWNMTFAKTVI